MQDPRRLPPEYTALETPEMESRIAARKAELGDALVILGHHYQRDEVIQFADFTGDSLKLAQLAARQHAAKYIVFCGVHFMAESADILSGDDQAVCLPSLDAGCAMADMADDEAVAAAIDEIAAMTGARVVPVTYVNSTAAVKAVTAAAGGACCTSGNVRNVFAWVLAPRQEGGAGGQKVFAVPDQHLGRNTAFAMGYGEADCAVYDAELPGGGLARGDVERATFLLWKGHCYVHQVFTVEGVRAVRDRDGGLRIIVHPECPREVVALADASGSTEQIIRAVSQGRPGSRWAIGTEANLVNRLARQYRDREVRVLASAPARCVQMARIDLPHLLWVLDNLAAGRVVNRISVPADIAAGAREALETMIHIKAAGDVTPSVGPAARGR
jgi:quinolinate synthase